MRAFPRGKRGSDDAGGSANGGHLDVEDEQGKVRSNSPGTKNEKRHEDGTVRAAEAKVPRRQVGVPSAPNLEETQDHSSTLLEWSISTHLDSLPNVEVNTSVVPVIQPSS